MASKLLAFNLGLYILIVHPDTALTSPWQWRLLVLLLNALLWYAVDRDYQFRRQVMSLRQRLNGLAEASAVHNYGSSSAMSNAHAHGARDFTTPIALRLPEPSVVDVWNVSKEHSDNKDTDFGELDPRLFQVRSADYLETRVKQSSGSTMYDFFSMFVFRQETTSDVERKRFDNITETSQMHLPEPPAAMQARCKKSGIPYYLVVHFQAPLTGVGTFSTSSKIDMVHLVYVFAIKEEFLAAALGDAPCTNAHRLTLKWLRECDSDEETKNRLKCITSAENFEVLNVSSMFAGYNGKPFMITRSSTVRRGKNYLEVQVNLLVFKRIAQIMFQSYAPLYKILKLRIGLTIQGESKDELPEQMLCSFFAHSIDHSVSPLVSGDQNVWLRHRDSSSDDNTTPTSPTETTKTTPVCVAATHKHE